MFDERILHLAPFEPHPFAQVARALPAGAMDEAIYDNVKKRYGRLSNQVIERIEYQVDGLRVTGAVARPATITTGKHPLMLFNRGGSGDYGMLVLPVILRYMLPFAEQEYIVLASNYRGNDGGDGTEEFGGSDVQDILTLIDIGKHHPGWDGKTIVMLGGSRGGMMTYLTIKQGAPLNAAATFGAVSDLESLAQARPEMEKNIYAKRFTSGEERTEAIAQRSATHWPQALASTPLLIMHGDADPTVPVEQSTLLAEKLHGLHPDFKLVLYPGGNHSLSTHAKEMITETLEWFAAHRD